MRHALGVILLLAVGSAQAASIFEVSRSVNGATINGTITTDGTIGTVSAVNILAWNLLLDDGVNSSSLTTGNSFIHAASSSFEATSTQLLFDYSAADSFFLFYENNHVGFWCLEQSNSGCAAGYSTDRIAINSDGIRIRYNEADFIYGTEVVGSMVPVPAAVWLFGSALAGLGWIRRKQTA
jgi:hypothetical protein